MRRVKLEWWRTKTCNGTAELNWRKGICDRTVSLTYKRICAMTFVIYRETSDNDLSGSLEVWLSAFTGSSVCKSACAWVYVKFTNGCDGHDSKSGTNGFATSIRAYALDERPAQTHRIARKRQTCGRQFDTARLRRTAITFCRSCLLPVQTARTTHIWMTFTSSTAVTGPHHVVQVTAWLERLASIHYFVDGGQPVSSVQATNNISTVLQTF